MTTIVDSKPYFKQRAAEVALTERVVNALATTGVVTLSQLAFCVGQPGQILPQDDFNKRGTSLLQDLTLGEKGSLKRLILEAQTLLVASLKDFAEHPEGVSTKKVGLAERNARLDKLRNDLTGIDISGDLEPAHSLLDAAMHQWDTRTLKYLGPEKCHSREAEVQNLKAPVRTLIVEDGKLTMQDESSIDDTEIAGSLQVLQALRRRGIAYAFANLINWKAHEKYLDSLFRFITNKGKFKGKGKGKSQWSSGKEGYGKGKWGNNPPKGYSKNSGKPAKGDWLPVPLHYKGASAWNKKGNRNCYGFNLGQCKDPNCQRGDHTCVIVACGGDHRVTQCPMKPQKL